MPVMPNATTTSGAATGYLWSFVGNCSQNISLDSGTINSRIIIIRYTDFNATVVGDSLRAQYNSDCGYSAIRAVKFSIPKFLYIQCMDSDPSTGLQRIA